MTIEELDKLAAVYARVPYRQPDESFLIHEGKGPLAIALIDSYPALRAVVLAAQAWLKEHDEFYDSSAAARAKENLRLKLGEVL